MVGISVSGCSKEKVLVDLSSVQDKAKVTEVATRISSSEASSTYDQGINHHQQGNLDKAITRYRETINADPKHAGAYLNLGTIYYNQGKFNHAIMSYKQAILINPDYVEAYLNLGAVYRTAGKL